MEIKIRHKCKNFESFRAEKVKSLFNPERGDIWERTAEIPVEEDSWQIGMVVGPSGSGKSSIGASIWNGDKIHNLYTGWSADKPIIDDILIGGSLNEVTAALGSVGLGDVPAWLRPFSVLSNGEQFRAGLARLICEPPKRCIVDEFTSVIDRQVAKIGAAAFAKSWRRKKGNQIILLSCHYDIIEWVQPDWVFDAGEGVLKKKSDTDRTFSLMCGRSKEITGSILKSIII